MKMDVTEFSKHFVALDLRKAGITFENGDDPHDFLRACEDNVIASNASDDAILNQIALCLVGSAYRWWHRSKNTITSWSQFKAVFLENFLPVDYELRLEDTLRDRIHYDNESFADFVDAIESICSKMERPPGEAEKVRIILRNVHPFFKSFFRNRKCSTMQELFDIANEAEEEIAEINRYRTVQQRLEGQYQYVHKEDNIPPLSRETPSRLYHNERHMPVPHQVITCSPSICLATGSSTSSLLESPHQPLQENISCEGPTPVVLEAEVTIDPFVNTVEDNNAVTPETLEMQEDTPDEKTPRESEVTSNDDDTQERSRHQQSHLACFVNVMLFLNSTRCSLQRICRVLFEERIPFGDPKTAHRKDLIHTKTRNTCKVQPILNPHVPSFVLTWSLLPPDLHLYISAFGTIV